jgi:hypothetical protein
VRLVRYRFLPSVCFAEKSSVQHLNSGFKPVRDVATGESAGFFNG